MANTLSKIFSKIIETNSSSKNSLGSPPKMHHQDNLSEAVILKDLASNKLRLKEIFSSSADLIFYESSVSTGQDFFLIYIEGFIDNQILNQDVIKPLLENYQNQDIKRSLYVSNIHELTDFSKAADAILNGNVLLFLDGEAKAYCLALKKWDRRSVEEPSNEAVVRGPKEGFVEYLETNIVLLRRRLKSSDLIIEKLKLGEKTQTDIALAYMRDIVNENVLAEIKTRLNKINVDSILESGYIEQYIEDAKYSPYATIGNTQKPDVLAGKILEGRVAIFCDGTPHVLTIPFLYVESFQTSEDYYVRTLMASILRLLRVTGLLLSTLLPAVYVALTSFHQEMIPNVLLISIAGAREGIPLPVLAETLVMGIMYELIRESGTRLPRAIGSAISIVGALVIGEAAVTAGLVSAPVVIITAVTAVSSFIIPALNEAMIVFRFIFLLLGGSLGLPGISCGIFFILIYTVSLRSFGIPYTSSLSPSSEGNMKDIFIRAPLSSMKKRPDYLVGKNKKRQGGLIKK